MEVLDLPLQCKEPQKNKEEPLLKEVGCNHLVQVQFSKKHHDLILNFGKNNYYTLNFGKN
jgi:hypothetical protein